MYDEPARAVKVIELSTREFINRDFPSKRSRFCDPYFTLREMNGRSLLRDALLAYHLNHYLTQNHLDVLIASGAVSSEMKIIEKNKKWLENFEADKYHDETQKLEEEENERERLLQEEPPNLPRRHYIR